MYDKSNRSSMIRNCQQFIPILGIRRRIVSLMLVGSLPLLLGADCGLETCDIFNCDSLFFVEGFLDSLGDSHDEGDEHVDDDHGDMVDDDMEGMADDHDDMDGMQDEHDDMDGEHDDDMPGDDDDHMDDEHADDVHDDDDGHMDNEHDEGTNGDDHDADAEDHDEDEED